MRFSNSLIQFCDPPTLEIILKFFVKLVLPSKRPFNFAMSFPLKRKTFLTNVQKKISKTFSFNVFNLKFFLKCSAFFFFFFPFHCFFGNFFLVHIFAFLTPKMGSLTPKTWVKSPYNIEIGPNFT